MKEKIENRGLTSAQKLATIIHDETCYHNHTDDCSWCYEDWNKKPLGWAKSKYLKKAEKMLKITDYTTAKNIIDCLNN